MRSSLVLGPAAVVLLLGAAPTAVQAQHVVLAARSSTDRYAISYMTPARAAAVERAWPRVVVIRRINISNQGRGRGDRRVSEGWWRSNGFRPVTVYYVDGRYYDRWDDRYRGHYVRQVVVYQRDGRLYRDWDDNDDGYYRDDRRNGGYSNRSWDRDDRYDRDDRDYRNR